MKQQNTVDSRPNNDANNRRVPEMDNLSIQSDAQANVNKTPTELHSTNQLEADSPEHNAKTLVVKPHPKSSERDSKIRQNYKTNQKFQKPGDELDQQSAPPQLDIVPYSSIAGSELENMNSNSPRNNKVFVPQTERRHTDCDIQSQSSRTSSKLSASLNKISVIDKKQFRKMAEQKRLQKEQLSQSSGQQKSSRDSQQLNHQSKSNNQNNALMTSTKDQTTNSKQSYDQISNKEEAQMELNKILAKVKTQKQLQTPKHASKIIDMNPSASKTQQSENGSSTKNFAKSRAQLMQNAAGTGGQAFDAGQKDFQTQPALIRVIDQKVQTPKKGGMDQIPERIPSMLSYTEGEQGSESDRLQASYRDEVNSQMSVTQLPHHGYVSGMSNMYKPRKDSDEPERRIIVKNKKNSKVLIDDDKESQSDSAHIMRKGLTQRQSPRQNVIEEQKHVPNLKIDSIDRNRYLGNSPRIIPGVDQDVLSSQDTVSETSQFNPNYEESSDTMSDRHNPQIHLRDVRNCTQSQVQRIINKKQQRLARSNLSSSGTSSQHNKQSKRRQYGPIEDRQFYHPYAQQVNYWDNLRNRTLELIEVFTFFIMDFIEGIFGRLFFGLFYYIL